MWDQLGRVGKRDVDGEEMNKICVDPRTVSEGFDRFTPLVSGILLGQESRCLCMF